MNQEIFSKFIGLLFLSFKFLIIPLCTSFISIIKLLTMKNIIKKAGKNYYIRIENKGKYQNIIIILSIIIIILSLLIFVFSGDWIISTMMFSAGLYLFSELFRNKKYGNITGIYENGIIDYNKDLISWIKIHSYKIKDKDIYGYFNDGSLFEYKNINNIDEIKYLFEKNNIKERKE